MNQSEDVSPSESSKCGTCYKLISYACLMWIIMLACTYLGYTYYYKEIDTSNTDSILFTPKQLVAIAIAITALISVLFLYVWNNGITKEKLNEILLNIVNNYLARILLIVIICIIAGNTKILEDKWQTG
jgi:quinol-cytochrome oxidoreductase complex cytochrome b subunit